MKYVLPPDTVRRIDAATIAGGVSGASLMDRAGRGAARVVLEDDVALRGTTLVVCGKGNNGGDGLVVARELHLTFHDVIAVVPEAPDGAGEAAWAREDARAHGVRIETWSGDDPAGALERLLDEHRGSHVVDAVLGTGTRLPLRGAMAGLAQALGGSRRRIVALDGPTGLDGATGAVDPACPRADLTIAFGMIKPGMVRAPGRAHCGRLHLVELPFPSAVIAAEMRELDDPSRWFDRAAAIDAWPRRSVDAHKFRAGSVFAVGGARGMSGAIALASNAAHRTGAGYVEATVPRSIAPTVDQLCIETLVHAGAETDRGGLAESLLPGLVARAGRHDALLIGPGAGDDAETAALLLDLISELDMPMVVDADALNAASRARRRHDLGTGAVLTPHTGELARLLDVEASTIEADRLHWAREAARQLGAVVLLKGAPTFVADPHGATTVIGTGGPELATAGSGDVLTGAIAALLSRGVDPYEAACLGATVHGDAGARAARELGVGPVMARDLLQHLAFAVRDVERGVVA